MFGVLMKKIETILKNGKLEKIKQALIDLNIAWMNIYELKAYGDNETHVERYRGSSYVVDFNIKCKIEIMTNHDEKIKDIIQVLQIVVENDIIITELDEDIDISKDNFESFLSTLF